MRKIFILILLTIFLSGCGIFNLVNFNMPDDLEFLAMVEELDTPQKICQYMKNNFVYKMHYFYTPDPYILWKIKEGDCNDFATFGIFVANYHGYETYQMHISFKGTLLYHFIAVYVENDKYTYSDNRAYYPINVSTFKEVIEYYFSYNLDIELKSYKVYDYSNFLIEEGK